VSHLFSVAVRVEVVVAAQDWLSVCVMVRVWEES